MNAHTPGPWSQDPNELADVRGPDGKDVAVAVCKQMTGLTFNPETISPESRVQANANARLIAAAPELLEALENILDDIGPHMVISPLTGSQLVILRRGREAVSKATGAE